MEALISNYWWVLVALLCVVLYKYILRFLFGMVIVPEDKIGLITKKIRALRFRQRVARWAYYRSKR